MPPQGEECVCQEYDQIAVLVKEETTYSEDSLPTPAEASLFTGRPTIGVTGTNVETDFAKPYWGNDPHRMTDKFVTFTGETLVAGPGSAGGIPGNAALLRSSGLNETNNVGVDTRYDPASVGVPSCTVYLYEDKGLWQVKGVRGSTKLMMQAGAYAKWQWDLMGLFALPSHAAVPPVIPAPSDADPLIINYTNTPVGSLFGTDVHFSNFELDMANVKKSTDRPGCYSVALKNRAPNGSLTICAPGIDVQDIRGLADAYTTGAINVVHGVNDGEIMEITVPKVQLDLNGIQSTDLGDNELGITVPYKVLPTSGDDDFEIIYR